MIIFETENLAKIFFCNSKVFCVNRQEAKFKLRNKVAAKRFKKYYFVIIYRYIIFTGENC